MAVINCLSMIRPKVPRYREKARKNGVWVRTGVMKSHALNLTEDK